MVQRPKEVIEKCVLKIENLCEIDKFVGNKSDEISSPKLVLYLARQMLVVI